MIPDEAAVRQQKLDAFREQGINPYPTVTHRTATCGDALLHFATWAGDAREITIAGRLLTTRHHGSLVFADLQDEYGKIQILLKEDAIDPAVFARFRDLVDPGDIVEATGTLFETKRGEKTLLVTSWNMLTKALLPLPEKWHGLQDVELRFRKRYLDLIMNPETMRRMVLRSKIISAIQTLLNGKGFLEVETPTLQPIYGGGFARPFVTHHHALDADFYLRISSEMYLKRLQVAGLERVYDIKKVFRNEGIDRDHNPEFTMFEAQIAYADYRDGMDLFEEIFEVAAKTALGTTEIDHDGVLIQVARPWTRIRLVDAVRDIGGLDAASWKTIDEAKAALIPRLAAKKVGELDRMNTLGEVIAFAFEELVEEQLIQPTIVYDFPTEVSPLAKKCADDPRYTERFEAYALGFEVGNNYTELNDPLDLEKRFIEEKKKEAAGFDEAHQTDHDYLEAIRHGLPPSCGLGIGIDRMVMLLTGAKNIKEVILFPTLRPEQSEETPHA